MPAFRDDFDGALLDEAVWCPHYLPAWSSRQDSRATYRLGGSCLTLEIPAGAGLWCADLHPTPLRVSGVQSGNFSGPVGSTIGQQRFLEGQTVREEQPRLAGWLPSGGHVEIRCRMRLSPRSMASMWLSGFEEDPAHAGELCVTEIFGRSVLPGRSAEVGAGVKQIHDPRLAHDFIAPRLELDVAEFHTYAVDWDAAQATFSVDGTEIHRCSSSPDYPMQVMLAVFDFPAWSIGGDDDLEPALVIDWVGGHSSPA